MHEGLADLRTWNCRTQALAGEGRGTNPNNFILSLYSRNRNLEVLLGAGFSHFRLGIAPFSALEWGLPPRRRGGTRKADEAKGAICQVENRRQPGRKIEGVDRRHSKSLADLRALDDELDRHTESR